mmetsp:Transcript_37671/g.44912  ORF Transcript_37671/g.44912 Transcript_37671/m.44912 type:complete len:112 (+) Transcript_37671:302-637(+)
MANVLEVEASIDSHLLVSTNIQIVVHQTNKGVSFAIIITGSKTVVVVMGVVSIKAPMASIIEAVEIFIAEDLEEVIHIHKVGEEEVTFQEAGEEAGEEAEEVDFNFNKLWA